MPHPPILLDSINTRVYAATHRLYEIYILSIFTKVSVV